MRLRDCVDDSDVQAGRLKGADGRRWSSSEAGCAAIPSRSSSPGLRGQGRDRRNACRLRGGRSDCRMDTRGSPRFSRPTLPSPETKSRKSKPVRVQFRRDATCKVTRGEAPPAPHRLPADRRAPRVPRSCADSGRYFPRVSGVEVSGQGVEGANEMASWIECDVRRAVETRRERSTQWEAGTKHCSRAL